MTGHASTRVGWALTTSERIAPLASGSPKASLRSEGTSDCVFTTHGRLGSRVRGHAPTRCREIMFIVCSLSARGARTVKLVAPHVEQLERLGEGIDQLSKRGAKESLVLMDDMAMIVGVPKKTVITAMSRNEAMGNIFTNIDSTLVVD